MGVEGFESLQATLQEALLRVGRGGVDREAVCLGSFGAAAGPAKDVGFGRGNRGGALQHGRGSEGTNEAEPGIGTVRHADGDRA